MFTGIIQKTAHVTSVAKTKTGVAVSVRVLNGWKLHEGQSIAVNGICSTVRTLKGRTVAFDYVLETIRKTTVHWWREGDMLNLEQSLRLGDPLDGHVVMGHVEGRGRIDALLAEKGEKLFKISASREIIQGIIKKGSIALDGVSLTVIDVADTWFAVALIPYTLSHTNWGKHAVGTIVNIETDILGRQRMQTVLGTYAKKKHRQR
jgi:riboflavin synthase alpha subunit